MTVQCLFICHSSVKCGYDVITTRFPRVSLIIDHLAIELCQYRYVFRHCDNPFNLLTLHLWKESSFMLKNKTIAIFFIEFLSFLLLRFKIVKLITIFYWERYKEIFYLKTIYLTLHFVVLYLYYILFNLWNILLIEKKIICLYLYISFYITIST